MQFPKHRDQSRRQILGDQAGTEAAAGLGMQPYRRAGRLEGRHALRHKRGNQPGEHVAGTGGGEPWHGVGVDGGTAVRCGDDGIGAL